MLQDELLSSALEDFFERNLITDVIQVLKSGKEATVCCCRAHRNLGGGLLAAKVYKPLEHRSFRNDQRYREGRGYHVGKAVRGGRALRALANKTDMGREIQMGSWVAFEWETLNHLHEIGADVPRPVANSHSGGAILMQYIGDDEAPAAQLRNVRLSADEARHVYERMLWNIELCLARNRIHGDLSPFNILYWKKQPIMIDFPQSVDPRENPRSYELLSRDIENVWRYCQKFAPLADPWKIAGRLWGRFLRAEL
jgi:RIO kinase 1